MQTEQVFKIGKKANDEILRLKILVNCYLNFMYFTII